MNIFDKPIEEYCKCKNCDRTKEQCYCDTCGSYEWLCPKDPPKDCHI